MALAVAVLAGGLVTYSSERISAGLADLTILTPAGSENIFCYVPEERAVAPMLTVGNGTAQPVTLISVTPLYLMPAITKVAITGECVGGKTLAPGEICSLLCPSEPV